MSHPDLEQLPPAIKKYINHLERMRRDFVANVSHELRTPLTVIRGYLESLTATNSADSSLEKIFAQMYQHSIRMENTINDLLLLSRLEIDDESKDKPKKIDIADLLLTLRDDAENISGSKKQAITLTVDRSLQLNGFEDELSSLFSNLIINAVKYTPAEGEIQIHWCLENNQAVFRVIDTGIGIAQEHLPRVTERFYRVEKGRSRASGGTGLGLAIVKHVLMRHQAELLIESELGKGSVFSCVFPAGCVVVESA